MEDYVLQNNPDLQFSLSTIQGNFSYLPPLAKNTFCHQYVVQPEDYENYSLPHWIGFEHLAPYYAEYLAGNGNYYMHEENTYKSIGIGCNSTPNETFISMDAHQKQATNASMDNVAQHQLNKSASTSSIGTKPRKRYSKDKASDTDRRRRIRIAAALDALESSLPLSHEGNKTDIVDNCIDYIKSLQHQLKELSQNRLGGEPISNHLMHLEGYGHFLVNESTTSGPLDDIIGKLLKENPSEATKLLESKDLFMMPIAPN